MKHGYLAPLAFILTIFCLIWSATSFAGQNANAVAHLYWQTGTGPGLAGRTSTDGQPQLVVTVKNLKSFRGAEIQLLAYSNDGTPLPGAWLGDGTGGCNDGNFQFAVGGFGGATYPTAFAGVPGVAVGQNKEFYQTPDCLGPTGIGLFWFAAAGAGGVVRDSTREYGLWSIRFDVRGTALGGNADCSGDLGDAGGPKPISIAALYRYPCSVGMKGYVIAITDINNQVDYVPVDPAMQTLGWEAAPVNPDITPPTVTVLSPNGGENLAAGVPAFITTTASDNVAVSRMDVALSLDGGQTYPVSVANDVPYTSSYSWSPGVVNPHARIRVTVRDASGLPASDASNANFAISDLTPPVVHVISPNGGEILKPGQNTTIRFNASDNVGIKNMSVYYSLNSGAAYDHPIFDNISYVDSLIWSVPFISSHTVRILVAAVDAAENSSSDASDSDFTVFDTTSLHVTLESPNGGESWVAGVPHTITWSTWDNPGASHADLACSLDGGATYPNVIATDATNTGQYSWTPPTLTSTTAKVRVTVRDDRSRSGSDASDANFTIYNGVNVTVKTPNGGETWDPASTHAITWTASATLGVSTVDLLYSVDGGSSFPYTIATGLGNSGTYSWLIPTTPTSIARVKVVARDPLGNSASDASDGDFTITPSSDHSPPFVSVVYPNGGEVLHVGQPVQLRLYGTDNVGITAMNLYWSFTDGFSIPSPIVIEVPYTDTLTTVVPNHPSTQVRLLVGVRDAAGNSASDMSDADLAILSVPDTTPPKVTVNLPNGGEVLYMGALQTISWTATDNVGVTAIDVDYSSDGGATFPRSIAHGLANSGSTLWYVPFSPAASVRVRVTAHDGSGNVGTDASDADFSISDLNDHQAPSVTLTSPVGGETWECESTQEITWTASDDRSVTSVNLDLSMDSGVTFPIQIASGLSNTGSAEWTVPLLPGPHMRIRVTARDGTGNAGTDASSHDFTIDCTGGPGLQLLSPNGGERIPIGSPYTVRWYEAAPDTSHRVTLSLSTNDGISYPSMIAAGVPDTGSYRWLVPLVTSNRCKIRISVSGASGPIATDESDDDFQMFSMSTPVTLAGLDGSVSEGRVELHWNLNSPTEVREVRVERREVNQSQYRVLASRMAPLGSMEYVDADTRPSTSYEYRVTAIAASGSPGVMSFRVTTPAAAFRVYAIAPNPFRQNASIYYSLTRNGSTTLDVLDVRGSIVRRLMDGMLDAGSHEVAWDGLTASGTPASAGIYFVRLASAGQSTVRRVVRLR